MKKYLKLLTVILLLGILGCGQKTDVEKTVKENAKEETVEETAEEKKEFEQEELLASLEKNLELMEKDPKDTEARLEVIRCQIGLKNYDVALVNLSMLMSINPQISEIYDLYVQISREEDNLSLARNAVSKATLYDVQEFLDKVSKEPVFSVEGGAFEDKVRLELTSEDPEAEIYYQYYSDTVYGNTTLYTGPIDIMEGEVRIQAYVLKEGIPSNTVEMEYHVNYPGTPVIFEDEVVEKAVKEQVQNELGYMPDVVTDIDCWKLEYINIDGERNRICLNDLKWLPNLYSLSIYTYDSGKIIDYTPLQYCKNLSNLYLSNGTLENLDFVKNMPNLSNLDVKNNKISDISALKGCTKLENLEITENPVSDISVALANGNIKYLQISDYQMPDSSEMKNLESLEITGFHFDSARLAKLTGLKELSIQVDWEQVYASGDYRAPVLKDISFVKYLPQLTYLNLAGVSDPEQLQFLYELENLETLYLYNSEVSEHKDAIEALKKALPNCNVIY